MAPPFLNNGLPPELDDKWLGIGVAFFLPLICGVLLEGTLPARPGFMFFVGLFAGFLSAFVYMAVTILKAHKR